MRGVIVNILLIFEKVPPQNAILAAIKWGNFCKAPHQNAFVVTFIQVEELKILSAQLPLRSPIESERIFVIIFAQSFCESADIVGGNS